MRKLVFDIETVGVNFDDLPLEQQEYLLKSTKNEDEQNFVKNSLGLYPFTGYIVTIGMYNIDTRRGTVLYTNPIKSQFDLTDLNQIVEDDVTFVQLEEKQMLEKFWAYLSKYDVCITFNGRCFDLPFIKIRSAILNVKCLCLPTDKNKVKFLNSSGNQETNLYHIDLLDVLTFNGCIRRFNLDFYCRAFGIESPKQDVSGKDVQRYFEEGRGLEIARYCYKDVLATAELFRKCDESFSLLK